MQHTCNIINCEEDAKYVVGYTHDLYSDSYLCEEHKDELEHDYRERLEEL